MTKFKLAATLVVALGVMSASASMASAAATIQPAAAVNFTGTNVGAHVFTLQGGTPSVSCTTATYVGTKPAGTPNVVSFTPTYSGCTTTIISTRPATVTQLPAPCLWRLNVSAATFTVATGATTGGWITVCNSTVITVPSIPACRITVAAQTITTGITGQNRTAGDAGNAPASGAAAGARVNAANVPAAYTASGCPGVTSPGTGSYSGVVYIPGVWVGP